MRCRDVSGAIVAGACGVGVGIWLAVTSSPLVWLLMAPPGLVAAAVYGIAPRIERRRLLREAAQRRALPAARVHRLRQ